MEKIVLDSHTLFWLFTGNLKLPHRSRQLIEDSESIIVPSIVLMEILYLLQKNNMASQFLEVLSELKTRSFMVYPLDLQVITETLFISHALEMHDRIIIATARIFDARIISKDSEIKNAYSKTTW